MENPLGIFFFIRSVCLSIKKIFLKYICLICKDILDMIKTSLIVLTCSSPGTGPELPAVIPDVFSSEGWPHQQPLIARSSGAWCLVAGAQLSGFKTGSSVRRGHCTQGPQPCLWQGLSGKKIHWCGCLALPRWCSVLVCTPWMYGLGGC